MGRPKKLVQDTVRTSVTIKEETDNLWEGIATSLSISKVSVLEMLIRERARAMGLSADVSKPILIDIHIPDNIDNHAVELDAALEDLRSVLSKMTPEESRFIAYYFSEDLPYEEARRRAATPVPDEGVNDRGERLGHDRTLPPAEEKWEEIGRPVQHSEV